MSTLPPRFSLEGIAIQLDSRIHHLHKQGNPAYHLKIQLDAIKAQLPVAASMERMMEDSVKRIEKIKSLEKQWAAYREELFRFRKLLETEKAEKSRIRKQEKETDTVIFI